MDKGNKVDLERLVCALSDSSTVGVHLALCMKNALRKQDLDVIGERVVRIVPEAGGIEIGPEKRGDLRYVSTKALVDELVKRGALRKFKVWKKVIPDGSIGSQDSFVRRNLMLDLVDKVVEEIGDKAVVIEDDGFGEGLKNACLELAVVL